MAIIRNPPLNAENNGCYAPGSALLRLNWGKVFLISKLHLSLRIALSDGYHMRYSIAHLIIKQPIDI